jgi:Mg-chelatase subunit ChlD
MTTPPDAAEERLRRWRLALGGTAYTNEMAPALGKGDQRIDAALEALYGREGESNSSGKRRGGLGGSAPSVARWLGDIRTYFPTSVVQVMQRDALERLNLKEMLLQPELLGSVVPDIHLVGTLLSLKDALPTESRATARMVVASLVRDLLARLRTPLQQAVIGSLNRSARNMRPRHSEIDWKRTIRANLRHYQPEYKTIIPERLHGYGRKRSALQDVVLCIDQSGSMAASVVYAGVFGAVMASIPALSTQMIVFDTAVVDLTGLLDDPVELLFGVQLGGGTDINAALSYAQTRIARPLQTTLILISDLYEGGNRNEMFQRVAEIVAAGVQVIALLALSDTGTPSYDGSVAAYFASLGIPAFACTPDQFPDLMAAALNRADIAAWAAARDITIVRAAE